MNYNLNLYRVLFDNNTIEFREQDILLDIFLSESFKLSLTELRLLLARKSHKFRLNELVLFTTSEVVMLSKTLEQRGKSKNLVQQLSQSATTEQVYGITANAIPTLGALVRNYKLRKLFGNCAKKLLSCLLSKNCKLVNSATELEGVQVSVQPPKAKPQEAASQQDVTPSQQQVPQPVVCIESNNIEFAKQEIIKIVAQAKINVCYYDRYVNLETLLRLAAGVARNKAIIFDIITENRNKQLKEADLQEFQLLYPQIKLRFRQLRDTHDRFILFDTHLKKQRIYHLGTSINTMGNDYSQILKINAGDTCYARHNSWLRSQMGTAAVSLADIKEIK